MVKPRAVRSGRAASDGRLAAMAARVGLGLGSNLGDREGFLAAGLDALRAQGIALARVSALYETEPVGGPPQGPYLNLVAVGETALGPDEVLAAARRAEEAAGRQRSVPNGPRTLDVDLLFHGEAVREDASLVLPHPRLHERRFVLVPLSEVAPEWRHPVLGLTASELLARCPDTGRVERWTRAVGTR